MQITPQCYTPRFGIKKHVLTPPPSDPGYKAALKEKKWLKIDKKLQPFFLAFALLPASLIGLQVHNTIQYVNALHEFSEKEKPKLPEAATPSTTAHSDAEEETMAHRLEIRATAKTKDGVSVEVKTPVFWQRIAGTHRGEMDSSYNSAVKVYFEVMLGETLAQKTAAQLRDDPGLIERAMRQPKPVHGDYDTYAGIMAGQGMSVTLGQVSVVIGQQEKTEKKTPRFTGSKKVRLTPPPSDANYQKIKREKVLDIYERKIKNWIMAFAAALSIPAAGGAVIVYEVAKTEAQAAQDYTNYNTNHHPAGVLHGHEIITFGTTQDGVPVSAGIRYTWQAGDHDRFEDSAYARQSISLLQETTEAALSSKTMAQLEEEPLWLHQQLEAALDKEAPAGFGGDILSIKTMAEKDRAEKSLAKNMVQQ